VVPLRKKRHRWKAKKAKIGTAGNKKSPQSHLWLSGMFGKSGAGEDGGKIIRRQMLYPLSYGCLVRAWNDIGFYAMLYYTPDSSLSPDPLLPTGYLFLSLTLRCIL